MKILCLSNGHGEDTIALRILEQLQHNSQKPELAALPIVGEGVAYTKLNIPIVGPIQRMPSGGFIMDRYQLWRDVKGGLIQLTLAQYQVIKQCSKNGWKILVVGDIVPLFFAWLSGADYVFVGTAKSEYYLRDESGWLARTSSLERKLGSIYYPWERWLMSRQRCKAVFPRDRLTAKIFQQWSIPAFDLGNPMMDGITPEDGDRAKLELESSQGQPLTIVLLPGSRVPEAQSNWEKIITATAGIISTFSSRKLLFLGAIAPGLDIEPFSKHLLVKGWNFQTQGSVGVPIVDPKAVSFTQKNAELILTQNAYNQCLTTAEVAIAMAGTATEQFVGLGKPAIAIPGSGPQFTYAFAKAQTRLLGCSVILVTQPDRIGREIQSLLSNPTRMQAIAENGKRRMGQPGAAARIARCLMEKLS